MNQETSTGAAGRRWYQRLVMRLWRRLTGNRWVVRTCGWPYESGYATYNPKTRTILDTGLSREHAQQICDELNAA